MYLEALSLGDTDPQREKRQPRNKGVKSNLCFKEKDIITIDMGCKYSGYCSDMTRTFFIGEPTEEQQKVFDKNGVYLSIDINPVNMY